MRKSKILIIENAIDVTGSLNSILRSSTGLSKDFDFYFILPTGSRAKATVVRHGFNTYELPMIEIRRDISSLLLYWPQLLLNCFRLRSLIKKLEIEVIVNNDFYNLLPVVYRLLGGRISYLCYVRFRPSKFPPVLIKLWSGLNNGYASSIIAVSEIVKKELPIQNKIVVIGGELPAEEILYKISYSSVILYPANYTQGKGHEFALRCFATIHKNYPEWKLKFVGSDMGRKKNRVFKRTLQQEAITLGVADKIEWGNFADNILLEYLNAAIVLNFSESESFSLTCLEAMYCGRPVISTKSGGPEEIINNDSGFLVNRGDLNTMSESLEYLISHPTEREEMGRKAYASVRSKFSYQNTTAKLKVLYNNVVQR